MSVALCILGVGGAGGRMVTKAAPEVLGAVHVAAVNTDTRELDQAVVPVKLVIGSSRTGGLGTGGAAATGRLAVDDDLAHLREFVAEKELVVVAAGLGGGTGSGAAPALLRAAREAGALTLAVVTMPFAFEGPKRQEVAREALRAVREATDAVVVLANDRLVEAAGESGVRDAFERVDAMLGHSISTLCNLVAQPGYIKLDFADLRQVLQHGGGTCALAYAEAAGADRALVVAQELVEGSLLERGKLIAKAKALLVGVVGGTDLTVREVGEIMGVVNGAVGEGCHVSMGTHVHETAGAPLRVVALVAEQWIDAEAPATGLAMRAAGKAARRGGRARPKETQPLLGLMPAGRGRFRNVEPTILDGEDLDIPTFVRRGLSIEG